MNDFMNIPTIKLSIDHMRQEIKMAVNTYSQDVQDQIDKAVAVAVSNYNFETEVKEAVNEAIKDTIQSSIKNVIGYEFKEEISQTVRKIIVERLSK